MKEQSKFQRPTAEQYEIMKQLKRDTKRAGLFRFEVRAKLVK